MNIFEYSFIQNTIFVTHHYSYSRLEAMACYALQLIAPGEDPGHRPRLFLLPFFRVSKCHGHTVVRPCKILLSLRKILRCVHPN